jgi:type IV pilus assembly protein PilC
MSNLPGYDKKNDPLEVPIESISMIDKMNAYLAKLSKVPLKEKLFFVQHLSIMLKAGISLSSAMKTLSKQSENKFFKKILIDVSARVEKGMSFTESLRPYERIFGELFINMIDAGETSGKLEGVLLQIFVQLKKQNELISKVKGALTYPLVILFAMGGIGVFMMIVVVPQITNMLQSFNTKLPLPTQILISVSHAIANNGILSVVIVLLVIGTFYQILRTYRGKYIFQAIALKLPIFSGIIKKINLARFTRTMSSLLKTDIMIIKIFQITANVLGNLHYREAISDMGERIKKGTQINEVVSLYPKLFPPMVAQMISVGEETGELDNVLEELAEFYEQEVDQIMNNLPSIIEPLLILVLGSAVGVMAVAIIMPMYSITTGI